MTSGGTILSLSLNFVTWIRDDRWLQAHRIMITIRYRVRYRVRNSPTFINAVQGIGDHCA
jgi:hypothetical protein